jgi:TatD DNase family protein
VKTQEKYKEKKLKKRENSMLPNSLNVPSPLDLSSSLNSPSSLNLPDSVNLPNSINLIDTHCHLNMLVKKDFDILMTPEQLEAAGDYISQAAADRVTTIINVGTSLPESLNSVALAQKYQNIYATIGIHPNDCTENWRQDFKELAQLLQNSAHKIVGIGECGIDMYRPGYNLARQQDAFKAHIELALEHNLALVIHSRTAAQETLRILDDYAGQIKRATMHCFSYDLSIAQDVIKNGFYIGIDAPITYPKNQELRTVVQTVPLEYIVLETDAPFLPPQQLRGSANHPKHIKTIAAFIAELRGVTLEEIAAQTTANARRLFGL